ncbi:hypothetical protein QN277_000942 [Acacia crassicarpa]|uniref:Uncharacterized protein n=1 Tax=Acacia crassicarpa TaxID=499986 RepID=A0AAE1N633_9FABA|nr:hypothetical protein QN277_025123 [Acacia crassicarpa]KAK4284063.1 hypothetical protein QN277_000942 [Acacia crassicarpa]
MFYNAITLDLVDGGKWSTTAKVIGLILWLQRSDEPRLICKKKLSILESDKLLYIYPKQSTLRRMKGETNLCKFEGGVPIGKQDYSDIDPNSELVCIHDSARPLVLVVDVKKVLNDELSTGAAVLGVPVKATIKEVENHLYRFINSLFHLWET